MSDPNPFEGGWEPTEVISEPWGAVSVFVSGRLLTTYRGVPTKVLSFSWRDPFDDATAEILFPGITPFEPLPDFLQETRDAPDSVTVTIFQRLPDGGRVNLWEGLAVSFAHRASEGENVGLAVQCIGALYQLDLLLRHPPVARTGKMEVFQHLREYISPRAHNAGSLRFRTLELHPDEGGTTGVELYPVGVWSPGLTGYVQEILNRTNAAPELVAGVGGQHSWATSTAPWTILLRHGSATPKSDVEGGRVPVLQRKDLATEHWTVHVGASDANPA